MKAAVLSDAMTHREKVRCLIADLRGRGVNRFTTAPPLLGCYGGSESTSHHRSSLASYRTLSGREATSELPGVL